MKATDILSSEHQVITRVITSLEKAANGLQGGKNIRPGFFLDASDFIKGFADGCHHLKEEGVLFPAMVKAGMSKERGPIAVMLAEHEQGRVYNRGIRAAALRLQAGELAALGEVASNALGYSALLRQHIAKEDNILFPMAGQVIPLDQQDALVDEFERVEHEDTGAGVHEKYLALAEKLEAEMA
jgi:hemerythrin-like domain-containing protein